MSVAASRAPARTLTRLIGHSRPRFWFYLAGPVLVGLAYGATSVAQLTAPIGAAMVAYFLLPANVFLYGINDVFDASIDAENPKKEGPERRYEGDRLLPVAVVVAAALGVALLVVAPSAARPWLAGFLVLGAAYSAPPLRFKARPVLDSTSNGLYALPGAAAYAALSGAAPPLLALVGGWCWTMAMHAFSAIPDREPDSRAGVDTIATALGREGTLAFCLGAWFVGALAFGVLDLRAGLLLSAYPVAVVAVLVGDADVGRVYWWFPAINVAVGTVLTLGGIWGVVGG